MKTLLAALAAFVTLTAPALAGGDHRWGGYGYHNSYRPNWGGYPAYYGYYAPRVYAPYAYDSGYAYDRDDDDEGDDCEIKRKWRHGELIEWLDCD